MKTRKFSPGNEWLYLKIYCGVKTADIILLESIGVLVSDLMKKKLINRWFFIRYNDPNSHLRLRFQLLDISDYNKILAMLNSSFKSYIHSGEIANIAIDSYVRELERYGENTMVSAEELFCKSSELVLNFLNYDDEEKLIVSMFYIEQFLSLIKLSATKKMDLINQSNIVFKKEFNADKNLNNQLKRKFAEFKPKYQNFVDSNEFEEIRNLIIINICDSIPTLGKIIEDDLNFLASFFQSIFHMHINRIFISRQRLFEMVVYDYLFRYNKNKGLKI